MQGPVLQPADTVLRQDPHALFFALQAHTRRGSVPAIHSRRRPAARALTLLRSYRDQAARLRGCTK